MKGDKRMDRYDERNILFSQPFELVFFKLLSSTLSAFRRIENRICC